MDERAMNAFIYGELKKDIRKNVHGKNNSEDGFLCSVCSFGDFGLFRDYKPNFCPNCGAKMDNSEEEKDA